jgi:hypothetical protein
VLLKPMITYGKGRTRRLPSNNQWVGRGTCGSSQVRVNLRCNFFSISPYFFLPQSHYSLIIPSQHLYKDRSVLHHWKFFFQNIHINRITDFTSEIPLSCSDVKLMKKNLTSLVFSH